MTRREFCGAMRAGEEAAVAALLDSAFGGRGESRLVGTLRREGAMAGEMVLPLGVEVIGCYALSAMRASEGWLCLAPVAIHPGHQRRGHGRRMIGQLAEWARLSRRYLVVLGQVDFYERAGLCAARAAKLTSPCPVAHTLRAGPGEDVPEWKLIYPKAFGAS